NVLQTGVGSADRSPVFVSDYFDFSIYVDADERHITQWYIDRFLTLRRTAFQNPASYFHRYARLSDAKARETAARIWNEINGINLRENILPTRSRADLILEKGPDHSVHRVRLRKL
ncbi:MAG: type I pantothenate kinase, partial [Blastocatellia bacterium]|nr:type I pantothenate kinase [Blastocatellia bacterium]